MKVSNKTDKNSSLNNPLLKEEDSIEENTTSNISFGITNEDIQDIIGKYDFREFNEEVEVLNKFGGNAGLEKALITNFQEGISRHSPDYNKRIEYFGTNSFYQEPLPHFCAYVWESLGDLMLRILIVAAIIQIGLGASPLTEHPETDWIEGIGIVFAIIVVVFVGSITNYTKEEKFKELNDRNASMIKVTAKRDGACLEISPDDILVGELIKITTGSIIPADGVIVSTEGQIKIDESSLTGESDLIEKEPIEICLKKSQEFKGNKKDKHSIPSPLIFSGTQVKEGNGWFVVWAVGYRSKKGIIQQSVEQNQENDDSKTPLEAKLDEIANDIGWFGIFAGAFTLIALSIRFGINYSNKIKAYDDFNDNPIPGREITDPKQTISQDVIKILLLCIAIIVVAIPEGLPLAVTLSLAFSINKMNQDNNLVRKMHACETMGGANYICTDKTGTLTANIMSVYKLYNGKKDIVFNNIRRDNESSDYFSSKYFDLLSTSIVCNLQIHVTENEEIIDSSKTDLAFANFLHNFNIKIYSAQAKYNVNSHDIKRIAFSSDRKKLTTIVTNSEFPTGFRVFIKGASEYVLSSVSQILDPEDLTIQNKSEEVGNKLEEITKNYSNQTLRTICVAYKDISQEEAENYLEKDDEANYVIENKGFTLICIVGIKDVLRNGVPDAIKSCQSAGINIIMVTGDSKETAVSISQECGIWNLPYDTQIPEFYCLTGVEFYNKIGGLECETCSNNIKNCFCPKTKREALLNNVPEDKIQKQRIKNISEFSKIIKDLKVLARSRPLDKYALVMGLRKLDNVVAVTGDGTNDAQALSKSDVGFAMGIEGTDIAKDAADIIILDDNFSSIVKAVVWGRNIYDCIRKFIQFQLTVNITACVLVFVTACVGNETPITAIQMLWLNMIMDSLGSLALATETPHDDILKRKPNSLKEYIINSLMWKHIVGHSIILFALLLVIYLKGPEFIYEQNLIRISEAEIINICFGVYPGRGPDSAGNYYIMSGSTSDWSSDNYLKEQKTNVECGEYAGDQEMSLAFKDYISHYGSSSHMTIMFNIFVYYTLFNQINSRIITDEYNIFYLIHKNCYFIVLIIAECLLQAVLIEFGSSAFSTAYGGLTIQQWGVCIGFSLLAFLVSIILKLVKLEILIERITSSFSKRNHSVVEDLNINIISENDKHVAIFQETHLNSINNNCELSSNKVLNKPFEENPSKDHSLKNNLLIEVIHNSSNKIIRKQSLKLRSSKHSNEN